MNQPAQYVLPRIERVLWSGSDATTTLIVPVPAGLPDRYDVLRVPCAGGDHVRIGCELPLDLAMEVASRPAKDDGKPLKGAA